MREQLERTLTTRTRAGSYDAPWLARNVPERTGCLYRRQRLAYDSLTDPRPIRSIAAMASSLNPDPADEAFWADYPTGGHSLERRNLMLKGESLATEVVSLTVSP
jgi:hypothetical protein